MTKRPVCVHCGAPFGHRYCEMTTVKWPLGEPMPEYRGAGIVTKIGSTYQTTSRATHRMLRMINDRNREQVEAELATLPIEAENVANLWVWDGKTWVGGYQPFCTLRCALDYAREAYNRNRFLFPKAEGKSE